MAENITPQSRTEALLQNAMGAHNDVIPQSRVELLLQNAMGAHNDVIPQSRVEDLLQELAGNSGGGSLIPGAIRSDAELWKSYSYDKRIVADEGVTLPSYSTSSVTLLSSSTQDTVELDLLTYYYFIQMDMLTIPEYSTSENGYGKQAYHFATCSVEPIAFSPSDVYHPLQDLTINSAPIGNTDVFYKSLQTQYYRLIYWEDANTIYVAPAANASSNGAYQYPAALTFDNSSPLSAYTMNIRSPSLSLKGNSNYLRQVYFDALTDIRYQWAIKVYRIEKGSPGADGFSTRSSVNHIIDCLNSPTHTLT